MLVIVSCSSSKDVACLSLNLSDALELTCLRTALERTYLAYIRTSLAFAVLGVTIAQLFRLQNSPAPNTASGFFVLGIPLASVCHGTALIFTILGAHRFWRQQKAMARGKIWAGGWEMAAAGAISVLVRPCSLLHANRF